MLRPHRTHYKSRLGAASVLLLALVASIAATLAASAGAASQTPSTRVGVGTLGSAQTCAFSKTGRKLGCLALGSDCNIAVWGNDRWLFAQEGFTGTADANAQRRRTGVWRIRDWPSRDVIGRAVATNAKQTRWKITNARGALVATARGPEGSAVAMVILGWGADCLE